MGRKGKRRNGEELSYGVCIEKYSWRMYKPETRGNEQEGTARRNEKYVEVKKEKTFETQRGVENVR